MVCMVYSPNLMMQLALKAVANLAGTETLPVLVESCRFSLVQIWNEKLRQMTVPHIWLGGMWRAPAV